MNDKERRELAADIATRVRMFSWQPMPTELSEALGEYDWQQTVQMYTTGPGYVVLRMRYVPRPQRLEMSFDANGAFGIGKLLWTPDHATASERLLRDLQSKYGTRRDNVRQ